MLTKNQIKQIKSLKLKKNRISESQFIVEGDKIVKELLSSKMSIKCIYATQKWIDLNNSILGSFVYKVLTINELEIISNLKTPNHVLAIVNIIPSKFNYDDLTGVTLILDNINDPGNFGTIVRLCDWFNISNIICSADSVDRFNSKVVQSSMGSLFIVNIIYMDLMKFFREMPYKRTVYGSFLKGENIKNLSIEEDSFIIMGNESHGISSQVESFVDKKISIKNIGGRAESLNVATATSILLYQFCNK
tara:strand:+ start:2286 stop:3029 length:744 start_codon:yes stop_codon:yes gene_type:complete